MILQLLKDLLQTAKNSKIKALIQHQMGVVMHRLVQLGEYCDCLQNWKKYDDSPEENLSDLYISENLSNIELPIQKVFQPEMVQNGFDKQLQILHQRLNKRKKIKAEYIKQKQKQRLIHQKQAQKIKQEKLLKIEREKQLLIREQELRKIRQQQAEKLRKQKIEKKIKANKRNKKLRDRQISRLEDLQISTINKQLSTTDQNILNADQNILNIVQNNSFVEEEQQQNFNQQEQQQENQKQQTNKQQEQIIAEKYQSQQNDEKLSDMLKYDIKSQKGQKWRSKDKGMEIIDLSKLDPSSMKDQISQLVLKKLNLKAQEGLKSQTVPLNKISIQSHRVRGDTTQINQPKKGHLHYQDRKQVEFQQDEIYFVQSQISHKKTASYFLDDQDKDEYFRQRIN